jgi:hypothetical protein
LIFEESELATCHNHFYRVPLGRNRCSIIRLAEFGGRRMSLNICRGTLGSLAMFAAIRRASLFRLPTNVVTVPAHTIFERVQSARAALNDAGLC